MGGDSGLQLGRHKGFYDDGAVAIRLVDDALFGEGEEPVVGHERSDLVAGEQGHFTLLVPHHHAHAIGVWIGPDDDVGPARFGLIDAHLERFGILGIG